MSNTRRVKSEAKLEDVIFTFDDEDYVIPHPKVWPLEAIEAQEDSRIAGFLKELLGEKQYAKFKKKPRTLDDLKNIFDALMDSVDMEKLDGSGE